MKFPIIKSSDLSGKASIHENYFLGVQHITHNSGVAGDGSNFNDSNMHIVAETNVDATARAQISLENRGTNACIIWLNTNGDLRLTTNDGKRYKFSLTELT